MRNRKVVHELDNVEEASIMDRNVLALPIISPQ